MKSNHKNFVQVVGLYTYCKMMYCVYNVKYTNRCTKCVFKNTRRYIIFKACAWNIKCALN